MVRIIALIIFLLIGIYTFETFTGEDFGVRRTADWMVSDGFAGGYGVATNVASGVTGAISGMLDGR